MSEETMPKNNVSGEDLEKEGRLEEAKEYYWTLINHHLEKFNSCASGPINRLRVIYAKENDWESAIKVCELYASLGRQRGGGNYEMKKRKMEEWAQKYRSYLQSDVKSPSGEDIIQVLLNKKGVRKKCTLSYQIKLDNLSSHGLGDKFPIGPQNIIRNNERHIPEFHTFVYSREDDIPHEILEYYDFWLEHWNKREALDLKGNDGYISRFMHDQEKEIIYTNKKIVAQVRYELKLLNHVYGKEQFSMYQSLLPLYLPWFVLYSYLIPKQDIWGIQYIEGCYEELFKVNSPSRIDLLNLVLSAKYKNKLSIRGIELFELSKRQILKHNISKYISKETIIDYLSEKIQSFETVNNINLLSLITQDCIPDTTRPLAPKMVYWKIYNYKSVGLISVLIKEWLREAENNARDQDDLPRIGEGWISETFLFNTIRSHFENIGYEVIHHARPPFLVRQELDIYVPAIKLGIEYQGIQHYKPITLFGGDEGLKYRKDLDQRKRELCAKNGIKLIEFSYEEPLEEHYIIERLRNEGCL